MALNTAAAQLPVFHLVPNSGEGSSSGNSSKGSDDEQLLTNEFVYHVDNMDVPSSSSVASAASTSTAAQGLPGFFSRLGIRDRKPAAILRTLSADFSKHARAANSFTNGLLLSLGAKKHQSTGADRKLSEPLISGLAYCLSSCSMILLNKVVLSSYNFNAGISLMLYQNFISVVIVLALGILGVVKTEKFTWKLVRVWMPVNFIFVGMLATGMYSLKYINVAMVTILKNMANILTATGETYFFKKRQNQKVWAALMLMVVSAVSGGATDLSFNAVGYTWQGMNCVLTASYSLTLRHVMDTAKQATASGTLNEVSMVLLNNSLSMPLGIFLVLLFGEWEYVYHADVIKLPMFWVVATASGILGLAISFTSMWFLNRTGPTTYSLVGSLNKIPISVAGLLLFKVPLSITNLFSILFGLFAGIFFAMAKMS